MLDLFKPKSLDALAVRYGTDKSHKAHNFAQFYDFYFSSLRDKPLRFLEIGLGRGSSLRMWRRYFKNAKLFAIEAEARRARYRFFGANVFIGRQEDREFMGAVAGEIAPLDIIVDDGSHRVDDQQNTLGFLFPFLKPGGYYILEDIHTSYPDPSADYGLLPDGSNSTHQMLLDFKKTGQFKSPHAPQEELDYLSSQVTLCEVFEHEDKSKHLTSILRKRDVVQ